MLLHRRRARAGIAASVLLLAALMAGCVPERVPTPTGSGSAAPEPDGTATPDASASPDPTSTSGPVTMPTDCRAILSESVLAELEGIPLNDPAWGQTGVLPDGSLRCIWADPGADTTGLTTTISRMSRGPALDMLNDLVADEGFTCYQPDEGTRCERQWPNPSHPVTDGRTLYWRDGVLIDTTYSNLTPSGYTSSIVDSLFT